jgi:hypothetical protein
VVQVVVSDTVISNNGTGTTGGGVLVKPSATGSAKVVLQRVSVEGNVFGARVDGAGSTGSGNALVIRQSLVTGNSQPGLSISVPAGGQGGGVFVDSTAVVLNTSTGILADGAALEILVSNSTISMNTTGVATQNGGSIFPFKTNNLNANGTDGAFTPPVQTQQ